MRIALEIQADVELILQQQDEKESTIG